MAAETLRSRPVIGITTSATEIPIGGEPLAIRYSPTVYDDAVWEAGGVPVHLPVVPEDRVADVLGLVDGIILSGGADVDPALYGQAAHASIEEVDVARDGSERLLTLRAIDGAVPVLGICRGLQVLNVALGGSLVQDLPSAGRTDHHFQHVPTEGPTHPIDIEPLSRLAEAFGRTRIDVNSVHHQAIHRLGAELVITARSLDGIVEGVEVARAGTWVVGVQWHPEAMQEADELQRRLFSALVERSRRTATEPSILRR
jgi:putative glutamine amidotransferase